MLFIDLVLIKPQVCYPLSGGRGNLEGREGIVNGLGLMGAGLSTSFAQYVDG